MYRILLQRSYGGIKIVSDKPGVSDTPDLILFKQNLVLFSSIRERKNYAIKSDFTTPSQEKQRTPD